MRLVIETKVGTEVRDPSLAYPVGTVVSILGGNEGVVQVEVDLDEDKIRSRLAERRGAF